MVGIVATRGGGKIYLALGENKFGPKIFRYICLAQSWGFVVSESFWVIGLWFFFVHYYVGLETKKKF